MKHTTMSQVEELMNGSPERQGGFPIVFDEHKNARFVPFFIYA